MRSQVKAWGKSQEIKIPNEILREASLSINGVLDVKVYNGLTLAKPFGHMTLEERAEKFGGKLKLDGEFDWGAPAGRETW
ncbi:MAG: AbrB/MazE/SpoVT family DNA-binding domain-containing protein [Lachnospiraceae bacterium]|nr:AbrB/MazE/SpoVT family DNA-binding domain-containing protein [Lachnospiraceae bacterium]